jgi:hypothetical protein
MQDPIKQYNKLMLKISGISEYLSNERKPPDGICVCVKPLDFPFDISSWIIEWIESNKLLGAAKIVFYVYQLHPNVRKVLSHYQVVNFDQ